MQKSGGKSTYSPRISRNSPPHDQWNSPRCLAEGTVPWLADRIEWLNPSEIDCTSYSLRKHPKRQVKRLADNIREFGFVSPLLISKENGLIAGHLRVLAAKSLGLDAVPVVRIEHLTSVQERALRIAENRIVELGEWDFEALARELDDLLALDLDISTTGFEVAEVDLITDRHLPKLRDAALEEVPELSPGKPPVSRVGDLWLLGNHRLICGDARNADVVATLMDRRQAAMVFTDPPYGVKIQGFVSGLGRTKHREFVMGSDGVTTSELTELFGRFLANACAACTDGALLYVCIDWRRVGLLLDIGERLGLTLLNICIWAKTNAGMGSFYRSQHEMVAVFKCGTGKHLNNIELGRFGRNRSNLWRYEGANSFNRTRRRELEDHPTPKPVQMIADALKDCTKRNDIILDQFLGSGSTLVAAEDVGRTCFGVELDPLYVDVAVRRWENFTKECAVDAVSGVTFSTLAERRSRPLLLPAPSNSN